MADIHKLAPFILSWEGGFVDDPWDRGGATNLGVTLSTWRQVGYDKTGDGIIDIDDLRLLTPDEVIFEVLKTPLLGSVACRRDPQSIVGQPPGRLGVGLRPTWHQNSPTYPGVTVDGIVGPKTLTALNRRPPAALFDQIHKARLRFINDIVRNDPFQKRFLKGWQNRINAIRFEA